LCDNIVTFRVKLEKHLNRFFNLLQVILQLNWVDRLLNDATKVMPNNSMLDKPQSPEETKIFLDVGEVLPILAGSGWKGRFRVWIENILGMTRTREVFMTAASQPEPAEAIVTGFGLRPDVLGVVESIPAEGPVIVVANHPFGGADAVTLIAICLRRRTDFRILANDVAATAPGIRQWVLPLSILGGRDFKRQNALSLRAAVDHLRGGGLLAVFPAGEVSTWNSRLGRVADKSWSPHIANLAIKARALVLPIRFFGENPPWFHLAGMIHPFARTALILRVLLASRGCPVLCRAGSLIDPVELDNHIDPTAYLRDQLERVELLSPPPCDKNVNSKR
jgi:1-acyl-sn-glycerol-3-phosphate acyltransferase